MKTFTINSLGCKVNQYESQQIRELLEKFGLHKVEPSNKPDLVVINSCCVTHTASAKSRQCIRKIRKQSPNAVIIVSGCLPTVQIGELSATADDVHLIRIRSDLADTLSCIIDNKAATLTSQRTQSCPDTTIKAKKSYKIKHKNKLNNHLNLPLTSFEGQTRAFLKIQDGCDGYCTYCIVPKTRPFVHSKPSDEVLHEAQTLVKAGHREIVVTGIFLGAYGRKSVRRKSWPNQQNEHLADLLDKMAKILNMERIRLSSLEPADLTPRLLDTFCKHPNIMPHLHLSLQSGSDNILRKMCRQYRAEEFREKVESAKSRLDRPAITTDIIVGFPGETDADFEQTVNMAKIIGFAKMHVFSFSPRKGTAAADMQESIDNKVIKERSQILRDLDIELGLKYRRQFIGETARILIENNNGQLSGRSERYFTVYLKKTEKKHKTNIIAEVKLIENRENGMTGAVFRPKIQ
ncbi:tRNA (N(6)-L-threonylcarbamoyladenosine(37)-C(2))-methylthiotransferase MtaB [Planctomycetota bacterium]